MPTTLEIPDDVDAVDMVDGLESEFDAAMAAGDAEDAKPAKLKRTRKKKAEQAEQPADPHAAANQQQADVLTVEARAADTPADPIAAAIETSDLAPEQPASTTPEPTPDSTTTPEPTPSPSPQGRVIPVDRWTSDSPESRRLAEIIAKRAEVREAKVRYEVLKTKAKAAKSDWEEKVDELTDLIDQDLETYPLWEGQAAAKSETIPAASETTPAVAETPEPAAPAEPAPNPDAWKTASIDELATCGLKPKLIEKLKDLDFATIGDLEVVRGSGDGLCGIEGVGKATAQKIEDAILEWLSQHRDKLTLEHAAAMAADKATADTATEQPTAAAPLPPAGLTSTTTPAGIAANDPDAIDPIAAIVAQIEARADEIATAYNDRDNDEILLATGHEAAWDAGRAAFAEGLPVALCPYVAGAEQDDWLRGWLKRSSLVASTAAPAPASNDDAADDDAADDGQ